MYVFGGVREEHSAGENVGEMEMTLFLFLATPRGLWDLSSPTRD